MALCSYGPIVMTDQALPISTRACLCSDRDSGTVVDEINCANLTRPDTEQPCDPRMTNMSMTNMSMLNNVA